MNKKSIEIPHVQGRNELVKIGNSFKIPIKMIREESDISLFQSSEAFLRLLDFIQSLNSSVQNKKNSQSNCRLSFITNKLMQMMDDADEIAPVECNSRFGNSQYRIWLQRQIQNSPEFHRKYVENDNLVQELHPYFIGSFGDYDRIDYGSGHELSFVAWLCCLHLVGIIKFEDFEGVVLVIFQTYLKLVRKIQILYNLEPAGSKGVWGLDDFQFLPYFWGSCQLLGND
jgi:serine/threonine-protein phosphatase 2A activator